MKTLYFFKCLFKTLHALSECRVTWLYIIKPLNYTTASISQADAILVLAWVPTRGIHAALNQCAHSANYSNTNRDRPWNAGRMLHNPRTHRSMTPLSAGIHSPTYRRDVFPLTKYHRLLSDSFHDVTYTNSMLTRFVSPQIKLELNSTNIEPLPTFIQHCLPHVCNDCVKRHANN